MCQRTNVPNGCELLLFKCQRVNKRGNMPNVPKDVPIFQTFLLRNAKGDFYALLLHKKFHIYLISQLHVWYVYVLYIKIISYFISISHVIFKKSAWNFCFLKLFSYLVKNKNIKRPGFYMLLVTKVLLVTSVFLNFQQLKQLNKMKNTCEYCDILDLWSPWTRDPRQL